MVICTLAPFTCVPLLARAWGWTCMVWDTKKVPVTQSTVRVGSAVSTV